MRRRERLLRERITELTAEVDRLHSLLAEERNDRQKFRDWWSNHFKWIIELHGKNCYPATGSLIESMAKFLRTVKTWPW